MTAVVNVVNGKSYSLEVAQALVRMPSALTETDATAIETLIDGVVADGNWNDTDVLIVPLSNEANSKINLKSSSYPAVPQNSPTFTAHKGWTIATSGSKYIKTGYVTNAKRIFMGGYMHVEPGDSVLMGRQGVDAQSTGYLSREGGYLKGYFRGNDLVQNTETLPIGYFSGERSNAGDYIHLYTHNLSRFSSSENINGVDEDVEIYVGCNNDNGTPASFADTMQIGCYTIGDIPVDGSEMRTRIHQYFTDVGTAV